MSVSEVKSSGAAGPRPAARRDLEETCEAGAEAAEVFAALLAALAQAQQAGPSPAPVTPAPGGSADAAAPSADPSALPSVTAPAADAGGAGSVPPASPDAAARFDTAAPAEPPRTLREYGPAPDGHAPAPPQQPPPAVTPRGSRSHVAAPGEAEVLDAAWHEAPHLGDPSKEVSLVAAELAARGLGARPPQVTSASLLSFVRAGVGEGRHGPQTDSAAAVEEDRTPAPDAPPDAGQTPFVHPQPAPRGGEPGAAAWDAAQPLRGTPLAALLREAAELRPRESRTLRLRLRPEELGEVRIELTRAPDGTVSARLDAETAAAARALSDNLAHLRSAMELAGLGIGQLGVGQRGAGDEGGAGRHAAPHQPPPAADDAPAHSKLETFKREAAADRLLTLHA